MCWPLLLAACAAATYAPPRALPMCVALYTQPTRPVLTPSPRAYVQLALPENSADDDEQEGERSFWDLLLHGQKGKQRPQPLAPPAPPPPPQSNYIPPEEWNETATVEAVRWEAQVQRDAQRDGSGTRQNEILRDELGKQ